MKPNLPKDQRKRLFLLARLLDKVPPDRFKMDQWIQHDNVVVWPMGDSVSSLKKMECGFAGCAMGWGMTNDRIRLKASSPVDILRSLGFSGENFGDDNDTGTILFGPHRTVTAKRVASDIRRYLKDSTLPAK